jgi:hypothetical protein
MIISHKHKFIFIKTQKTAGSSIEAFLSQHCGPEDVLTPVLPIIEGHKPRNYEGFVGPFRELRQKPGELFAALRHPFEKRKKFYNHMPAWLVRTRVTGKLWKSYFKFCVERNPWDKVLSHFHMMVFRKGGSLTFEQYLAKGKFPINYPRYTDPSGAKIIVDRVVRYENLNDELAEVFAQVHVPFQGSLGVRAKSDYRTDRRPYQLVYSDEQRRIIEKAFAREIQMHGYRFEASP